MQAECKGLTEGLGQELCLQLSFILHASSSSCLTVLVVSCKESWSFCFFAAF